MHLVLATPHAFTLSLHSLAVEIIEKKWFHKKVNHALHLFTTTIYKRTYEPACQYLGMVCYKMCALPSDQGWLRHWYKCHVSTIYLFAQAESLE